MVRLASILLLELDYRIERDMYRSDSLVSSTGSRNLLGDLIGNNYAAEDD